jgi:precorrin-6A synthase
MRRILLIGAGAGDPAHITMQAVAALNDADVVLAFDKGEDKDGLMQLRREICARYVTRPGSRIVQIENPQRRADAGYLAGVDAWHQARADLVRAAILREVPDGGCAAFLVWGEPGLYDSTLRVVERAMVGGGLDATVEIVPGISSVQVLAAHHRICLNEIGEPVLITTGRRLAEDGMPARGSAVVMLDGGLACAALTGQGLDIYWGAGLGTADEVLVAGKLDEAIAQIRAERAAFKAKRGWVMDTYLLRRRPEPA